ncbi:MAG: D,D-dipeptide ABC transporter permease, partial [Rhizobiaceae bacterium]
MKSFLTTKGLIGMVLVLAILLIAIFAPLFIPAEFATKMNMRTRLDPPSLVYLFGTDQLGRDMFYRVML